MDSGLKGIHVKEMSVDGCQRGGGGWGEAAGIDRWRSAMPPTAPLQPGYLHCK